MPRTVLHVITLGSTPAAHMCLKREMAWPGCAGLALAHAEMAELYEYESGARPVRVRIRVRVRVKGEW